MFFVLSLLYSSTGFLDRLKICTVFRFRLKWVRHRNTFNLLSIIAGQMMLLMNILYRCWLSFLMHRKNGSGINFLSLYVSFGMMDICVVRIG